MVDASFCETLANSQQAPEINLDDWCRFGEGSTSDVFYNKADGTLFLKLLKEGFPPDFLLGELRKTRAAMDLGFPVPTCYGHVYAGNRIGLISERILDNVSLGKKVHDDPDFLEKCAWILAENLKLLTSTQADMNRMDSAKAMYRNCTETCTFFPEDINNRILSFIETIPDVTTCLHGDFHTGNIVIAQDKVYLIDLACFTYGYPLFDVASLYFINKYRARTNEHLVRDLYHLTAEQAGRIWELFCKYYAGIEGASDLADYEHELLPYVFLDCYRKAIGISFVRNLDVATRDLAKQAGFLD